MTSFAIGARLLRGAGRHGFLGTLLTLVAVAIATLLLLAAIAANGAFGARADRTAWMTPSPAPEGAGTMVQTTHVEYVRERPITVIDVAVLDPAGAVPPPGLSAFPAPGRLWASAALTDLLAELPADQLADRFPAVAGRLPDEVLAGPGQLVALVGREADDPVFDPAGPAVNTLAPPTAIASFAGGPSLDAYVYGILLTLATAMVIAPLLIFGAAAARLTVARRDARLAALRLIGATPAQVVAMTVAEAVLTACAGAVLGAAVYAAGFAGLARIPMQGEVWFTADLWVGVPWFAAVLAGVPVLTGISAAVGLRRVVVSPLGVARRQTPPGLRVIRVVALAAALAAAATLTTSTGTTVLLLVLGTVFLAINLTGPWVVALLGRITAAVARRPARLLAGRRLVDDPRSSWRTVAGIALTGFVAGFIGLLSPDALEPMNAGRAQFHIPVVGEAEDIATTVTEAMAAAGIEATVTSTEDMVNASVPADPVVVDRAKTVLVGAVPGRVPYADVDDLADATVFLGDVQVGIRIVLIVSFTVAIASAGIAAASSVLDRRRTYAQLRLAGTPLRVLDRARAMETHIPLLVMGAGSIVAGVFCGIPFVATGAFRPSGMIVLGAFAVIGFAGVLAAGALSRPLLRSVANDPAPQPD